MGVLQPLTRMEKTVRVPIRTLRPSSGEVGATPNWLLWLSIGAFAVLIRIVFALIIGRFWHLETWEQEAIAQHLLRGEGFIYEHMNTVYRSYCEPLYPFLVAGVYALTNQSHAVLFILQAFLYSLTAILAGQIAWLLTGQLPVAVLAALLIAVDPALVLYTTKQHPLVLDALMVTSVSLAGLIYARKPTTRQAVWVGIALGLCILTRPTIVAALPLIAWWIWRRTTGQGRTGWQRALLMTACAVIIVTPWVLRNARVQGQFVLTRSNTPFVFWLGNNPHASGSAVDLHGEDILSHQDPKFMAEIRASNEMTQNRMFGKAAMDYIRSDPLGFIRRTAQKWFYFWWFSPQAGILYPKGWIHLYKFWWGLLCAAGLLGAWSLRTVPPASRSLFVLPIGIALVMATTQSFFYIEGRHRLSIEPILIGLAALGLVQLWTKWKPNS